MPENNIPKTAHFNVSTRETLSMKELIFRYSRILNVKILCKTYVVKINLQKKSNRFTIVRIKMIYTSKTLILVK